MGFKNVFPSPKLNQHIVLNVEKQLYYSNLFLSKVESCEVQLQLEHNTSISHKERKGETSHNNRDNQGEEAQL